MKKGASRFSTIPTKTRRQLVLGENVKMGLLVYLWANGPGDAFYLDLLEK